MPDSQPRPMHLDSAAELRRGSLAVRELRPEVMDRPDLEPWQHDRALAGLARLNRWAGSARTLWPELQPQLSGPGPLTLLDVACGSADVSLALAARTRRAGKVVEVLGCDRSERAIAQARRLAQQQALTSNFIARDVLAGDALPRADIVLCTLFLHHLEEVQAVHLLQRLAAATRSLLLVVDLRRGRLGYGLAWAATRLLSRSPIVHRDGPDSVRSAFTPEELAGLALRAGLPEARVRRIAPLRQILRWTPPEASA
ncbi:MAG: methyltransferase domain-containing protein [Planctomycetota bacterium]